MIKDLLKHPPVIWTIWCIILGLIGYSIHDPNLYQPWYVWVIGSLIFESILLFFMMIIASITTSLFVWNYTNILREIAGSGLGVSFNKSERGDLLCSILLIIQHLTTNIVMFYVLYTKTH